MQHLTRAGGPPKARRREPDQDARATIAVYHAQRGEGAAEVLKVKAHTSEWDLEQGRVTYARLRHRNAT
eukprot:10237264-Lingulodinium_polyedra.AAC.1